MGLNQNEVTLQAGVHDLGNDVPVREADDQAVLRCVADASNEQLVTVPVLFVDALFILRLGDQALASVVFQDKMSRADAD